MAKENMIECLEKVLRDAGLGKQVEQVYSTDPVLNAARTETMEKQRDILNVYWLRQLQAAQIRDGHNTMDARFCLIDKGTPESWFKLFKSEVLPVAIQCGLPAH